ncbi:hypothetical protein PM082_018825 [Marasmius tenuissimus]|nr:hypothetical protein PM082_018825 [Marasmius tenuissimus]
MYPDPYAFKPERWIEDGKINLTIRDVTSGFGFGRRIYPGRFLAMSTMYISAASILAAFDISKAVDKNGAIIEPKVEYASNIQNRPLPFECSIKPRSEKHKELVMETYEQEFH